jgi:hypothetical protein
MKNLDIQVLGDDKDQFTFALAFIDPKPCSHGLFVCDVCYDPKKIKVREFKND